MFIGYEIEDQDLDVITMRQRRSKYALPDGEKANWNWCRYDEYLADPDRYEYRKILGHVEYH